MKLKLLVALLMFAAVSLCAQTHSATLAWTVAASGDPATSFNIWRTAGATCAVLGGAAVPSGAVPFATVTSGTTLTYIDSAVVGGSTYCYTVSAVNGTGQSVMSNSVDAVVPLNAPGPVTLTITVK